MKKKVSAIFILFLFILPSSSMAVDSGYVDIVEMKSWTTMNNMVYLTVAHQCGGPNSFQYELSKDENQQYTLLLSSFIAGLKVNLNYTCNANGYPAISGVRAKKP